MSAGELPCNFPCRVTLMLRRQHPSPPAPRNPRVKPGEGEGVIGALFKSLASLAGEDG